MKLSHYSPGPFTFDPGRTYTQEPFLNGKPRGLWLSVDGPDDWPAWCVAEDFRIDWLAVRTPFMLTEEANVLVITTVAELEAFTEEYRGLPSLPERYASHWLNWVPIAERYDGIIITPYLWEARLNLGTFWYYGWDCSSGVIWNLSAITPGAGESLAQIAPLPSQSSTPPTESRSRAIRTDNHHAR